MSVGAFVLSKMTRGFLKIAVEEPFFMNERMNERTNDCTYMEMRVVIAKLRYVLSGSFTPSLETGPPFLRGHRSYVKV